MDASSDPDNITGDHSLEDSDMDIEEKLRESGKAAEAATLSRKRAKESDNDDDADSNNGSPPQPKKASKTAVNKKTMQLDPNGIPKRKKSREKRIAKPYLQLGNKPV